MTSMNVLGTSTITLQFDLDRNIDAARTDVLEAINAAQGQLPKDLPSQPTIRKVNPADAPIMILAVQSDAVPLTEVDDYAENILAQQLSQIAGVSQVLVGGQQKPAIRVQIDPAKLASMGLTLEDVRNVLTNATVDEPEGQHRRRRTAPTRSTPTISSPQPRRTTTSSWPIATARRSASAISAEAVAGRRTASWPPGRTASAASCCWSSSSRAPTSSPRCERDQGGAAAAGGQHPAGRSMSAPSSTARRRSAPRSTTWSSRCCCRSAWCVMVIFLFLRNVWATIIPSITVPVALIGTFGAMYLLRLQPRQPVADGR